MASTNGHRLVTDGGTDDHVAVGEVVHTTATADVRVEPALDAPVLDTKPPCLRGTVVGGYRTVAGVAWVQVEFDDDRLAGDDPGWVTPDGGAVTTVTAPVGSSSSARCSGVGAWGWCGWRGISWGNSAR